MNFFGKKNAFKGLSIGKTKFKGSGSALGGSRPGKVFSVIFVESGPLGMTIEKTEYGGAVVSKVEPSGPANEAGITRGDVVCWSGTEGEEAPFLEFMAIVKEGSRPLEIDIKRLQITAPSVSGGASAAAESRRLAVIAAADARAKKSQRQQKPIPKRPIDLKNNTKTYDHSSTGPKSDAAAKAVAAAKASEANLVNELGYNPYETVKMGSGKAKGCVDKVTNGELNSGSPVVPTNSSGSSSSTLPPPASVQNPKSPNATSLPSDFTLACSTLLSSSSITSLKTLSTLLKNATQKGPSDPKYLTIKLSNTKIQEKIVQVEGCVELLMSCGFEIVEREGEDCMVYNLGEQEWLMSGVEYILRLIENE